MRTIAALALSFTALACYPQDLPQGLAVRPDADGEVAAEPAELHVMLSASGVSEGLSVSLAEVELESGGAWMPALGAVHSYDLASLAEPAELLAVELPEQASGEMRLVFLDAWRMVGGEYEQVEVSEPDVLVPTLFPVEAGRETTVYLELDASRSLTTDASGRMALAPVVNVKAMSVR